MSEEIEHKVWTDFTLRVLLLIALLLKQNYFPFLSWLPQKNVQCNIIPNFFFRCSSIYFHDHNQSFVNAGLYLFRKVVSHS